MKQKITPYEKMEKDLKSTTTVDVDALSVEEAQALLKYIELCFKYSDSKITITVDKISINDS